MSDLLPILPLAGDFEAKPVSGHPGALQTLPISSLRIDDTYQRAISAGSIRVIKRIVNDFDWAKFLPVIVVQDGDVFSVVDGQHRTTAAATIGITEVPCYVLRCTAEEAAAAFAAINGNVTPVAPVDLWFAMLAARDPDAVKLQRVLDAANVKVTRRKSAHGVGETRSINVLRRALDFYGGALLTTILQCITETGDGNPGMLVGAVIHGVGQSIRTKPELLADPSSLFDVFDGIDLGELLERAKTECAHTGNIVQAVITREINAKITKAKERADAA